MTKSKKGKNGLDNKLAVQMDQDDLVRMNQVLRHRLRNFASGIKTATSLLSVELEDSISYELQEYFPLIINECEQIKDLTGRLNMIFEPVSLEGVNSFSFVLEKLDSQVHSEFPTSDLIIKGEDVVKDLLVNAGESVFAALYEIVKNAIESAHSKSIVVECELAGDNLSCKIIDSGCGVPEVDIDKLFLPFFTTKTKHLGVGLTIARRLVSCVGGEITASHNPQGGLIVDVSIPLAEE